VRSGVLASAVAASAESASAHAATGTGQRGSFGQVWAEVMPATPQVEVQSGDTLIGLVKAHYRQNQQAISEGQATRLAHQVATHNLLINPDLIFPGQAIDFSPLKLPPLARSPDTGPLALNALSARALSALGDTSQNTATAISRLSTKDNEALSARAHPVLDRTLARAAEKGFVPTAQLSQVRDRVLALAQRYNFQPDDFARLTLMESGGMNPQASNGNCHGIIQFCDGPNRGAASVGFKNNPRDILGVGLLQQLDLVDRYFEQAGLPVNGPPVGLDDLYLTVLTPAARRETRPDAALPIAGPQARYLHVGHNTQAPITRNSILSGLQQLSDALLGPGLGRSNASRRYADAAQSAGTTWR
jgi:hypothetical protein